MVLVPLPPDFRWPSVEVDVRDLGYQNTYAGYEQYLVAERGFKRITLTGIHKQDPLCHLVYVTCRDSGNVRMTSSVRLACGKVMTGSSDKPRWNSWTFQELDWDQVTCSECLGSLV